MNGQGALQTVHPAQFQCFGSTTPARVRFWENQNAQYRPVPSDARKRLRFYDAVNPDVISQKN
jgi:hypothetical protein